MMYSFTSGNAFIYSHWPAPQALRIMGDQLSTDYGINQGKDCAAFTHPQKYPNIISF